MASRPNLWIHLHFPCLNRLPLPHPNLHPLPPQHDSATATWHPPPPDRPPQHNPPHGLLRHGPRVPTRHLHPSTDSRPPSLFREGDPTAGSPLLLGVRLLPLEDLRVHRHVTHHPEQLDVAEAFVPPRVPPRHRGGHVLHLAPHVSVDVPRSPSHQLGRPRCNVLLLPALLPRDEAQVEEDRYGLSDCAVLHQLWNHGLDLLRPFYRVGLLRDLGLVL
ncbi:hypothetical protein LINGRAHAP2_LOCUS12557 [Linum grandiflorum]